MSEIAAAMADSNTIGMYIASVFHYDSFEVLAMLETAALTTERNTSGMCNASSFPSESCEVLVSVSISGQQCNWYVHHSYILCNIT